MIELPERISFYNLGEIALQPSATDPKIWFGQYDVPAASWIQIRLQGDCGGAVWLESFSQDSNDESFLDELANVIGSRLAFAASAALGGIDVMITPPEKKILPRFSASWITEEDQALEMRVQLPEGKGNYRARLWVSPRTAKGEA